MLQILSRMVIISFQLCESAFGEYQEVESIHSPDTPRNSFKVNTKLRKPLEDWRKTWKTVWIFENYQFQIVWQCSKTAQLCGWDTINQALSNNGQWILHQLHSVSNVNHISTFASPFIPPPPLFPPQWSDIVTLNYISHWEIRYAIPILFTFHPFTAVAHAIDNNQNVRFLRRIPSVRMDFGWDGVLQKL